MIRPVQTANARPEADTSIEADPCGHIYCYMCISHWLDPAKPDQQNCPICRRSLTREQLFTDVNKRREIASIVYRCPRCAATGHVGQDLCNLADHFHHVCKTDCPCCGSAIHRAGMEEHLANGCPVALWHTPSCPNCHMVDSLAPDHLSLSHLTRCQPVRLQLCFREDHVIRASHGINWMLRRDSGAGSLELDHDPRYRLELNDVHAKVVNAQTGQSVPGTEIQLVHAPEQGQLQWPQQAKGASLATASGIVVVTVASMRVFDVKSGQDVKRKRTLPSDQPTRAPAPARGPAR